MRWMKRWAKLGFGLLMAVVAFALCEATLRIAGYKPGLTSSKVFAFKDVDSLINYNYFLADAQGLQVANRDCTAFFAHARLDANGFLVPNTAQGDTVMYVGDSFLWGTGAPTPQGSFFNILANGYNFGIPGADVPQYHKIIELYVPQLKPKHVVLCFFMGNDILTEDRELQPFADLYYETNAGFILGYHQGKYLTLEEALTLARDYYMINTQTTASKVSAQSALLTFLFYTIPQWRHIKRNYDQGDYLLVNQYLHKMQQTATANGARFSVFIIPSTNQLTFKPEYEGLFHGVDYYWPTDVFEQSDFDETSHFNASGNRKFANFIKQNLH